MEEKAVTADRVFLTHFDIKHIAVWGIYCSHAQTQPDEANEGGKRRVGSRFT
jgi:hypothetical protein